MEKPTAHIKGSGTVSLQKSQCKREGRPTNYGDPYLGDFFTSNDTSNASFKNHGKTSRSHLGADSHLGILDKKYDKDNAMLYNFHCMCHQLLVFISPTCLKCRGNPSEYCFFWLFLCLYTGTMPTQLLPHAYAEWEGCLRGSFPRLGAYAGASAGFFVGWPCSRPCVQLRFLMQP